MKIKGLENVLKSVECFENLTDILSATEWWHWIGKLLDFDPVGFPNDLVPKFQTHSTLKQY